MKKLILCLSLAFLAISCGSNDDDDTSVPVEETPVLPTKLSTGEDTGIFKYNGNMVSEINWGDYKVVCQYTGNVITKMIDYDSAGAVETTTDFTYSNDKLTKAVFVEGNTTETSIYSYPSTNTVNATVTRNSTSQGSPVVYKDVITYTLNNGNVVSEEMNYYVNGTLKGKISATYTYDDKNTAYKNILGFDKIMIYSFDGDENTVGRNNLLIKNHTNTPVGSSISKYKNVNTITYSTAGYPTQIITNQYNANNQLNSTNTDFYEYNK